MDHFKGLTRGCQVVNTSRVLAEEEWGTRGKCRLLTPQEADTIFFPGPGNKVNKARQFCGNCPVQKECLNEALTKGWAGFWSGTTEDERKNMRSFVAKLVSYTMFMPPEPTGRRIILRKIIVTPDPHAYLDEIEPADEEIQQLEAV